MADTVFVSRDSSGAITGRYAVRQAHATEQMAADAPELMMLDARPAKLLDIERQQRLQLAAGVTVGGVAFQLDGDAVANITAWGALSASMVGNTPGAVWPADFVWIASDNSRVAFTAAAFFAFAQLAAARVTSIKLHARALKDAVVAATTPAALAAIDTTSGWE